MVCMEMLLGMRQRLQLDAQLDVAMIGATDCFVQVLKYSGVATYSLFKENHSSSPHERKRKQIHRIRRRIKVWPRVEKDNEANCETPSSQPSLSPTMNMDSPDRPNSRQSIQNSIKNNIGQQTSSSTARTHHHAHTILPSISNRPQRRQERSLAVTQRNQVRTPPSDYHRHPHHPPKTPTDHTRRECVE